MASTVSDQFRHLRATLAASLIEREPEIDAMLLGLVAQEHVLLVGPPGTGKSALANGLTRALDDGRAFSLLLTKFTTPEEVFGPVMISALKEDRYERNVFGYAPTAHVIFFDEIWKASSAILNTTLTLLQERAYDNGGRRLQCSLQLAIAASNEWPSTEDGQELGAVFDRFLIRRVVRPVSPSNRGKLLFDALPAVEKSVGLKDIGFAATEAAGIPFSDDARGALHQMLDQLGAAGVRPGDRRSRKAVGIARAAAWLADSTEVQPAHLECLSDVLWSSPEQIDQTADIVLKIANPLGSVVAELMREANEILSADMKETPAQMEGSKKLGACLKRAKEIVVANPGNKRAADLKTYISIELRKLSAKVMGIDDDQAATALGGGK